MSCCNVWTQQSLFWYIWGHQNGAIGVLCHIVSPKCTKKGSTASKSYNDSCLANALLTNHSASIHRSTQSTTCAASRYMYMAFNKLTLKRSPYSHNFRSIGSTSRTLYKGFKSPVSIQVYVKFIVWHIFCKLPPDTKSVSVCVYAYVCVQKIANPWLKTTLVRRPSSPYQLLSRFKPHGPALIPSPKFYITSH